MLIVTYDISDNKLRTRFAKFLQKYGHRLQYSVFEVRNSKRLLRVIESEIEGKFEKQFDQTDSIMIFNMSKQCGITKYGYAANDDEELIIL